MYVIFILSCLHVVLFPNTCSRVCPYADRIHVHSISNGIFHSFWMATQTFSLFESIMTNFILQNHTYGIYDNIHCTIYKLTKQVPAGKWTLMIGTINTASRSLFALWIHYIHVIQLYHTNPTTTIPNMLRIIRARIIYPVTQIRQLHTAFTVQPIHSNGY